VKKFSLIQLRKPSAGGWKKPGGDPKRVSPSDFSTNVGSGGFGDVFYGKLPDGQEIAAKVLSAESHQSKQEFYNEVGG
jgi:hypothetical protein